MTINPQKWFGKRQVDHTPPHFVKCESALTNESLLWVTSRLVGRYSITEKGDLASYLMIDNHQIYFEDPAEATLYELRWAGSK